LKASLYYSKLLLFGEYTIIDNGTALSVPFRKYSGHWSKSKENGGLTEFFDFLLTLEGMDQQKLRVAKEENWSFESNIPIGCGLGSSGALSAAAYDSFKTIKADKIKLLRKDLASIESFFHGQSSGLDPLTSYCNKAIVVGDQKEVQINRPAIGNNFFLIDSKIERNSKELISWFSNKKKTDKDFQIALMKLNRFNTMAIESILCSNDIGIENNVRKISNLQFEFFQKLIPESIKELWKAGFDSDQYYMKLAGAGGGGYFLGYGQWENLNKENIVPLSFDQKQNKL